MNEKPEALRLADAIDYVDVPFGIRTAAKLRRLHAENEALTATRDRQAAMLRRLEEREAELDAEIGHLRRENERLREALQDIARQPEGDEDSAQAVAKAALRREDGA